MIKGIKICGVSDLKTLRFIVNHPYPPSYIGFITNYKKSKRFVDYEKLKELTRGHKVDKELLSTFIEDLEIPTEDKQFLLSLTPHNYIGLAAEIAKLK